MVRTSDEVGEARSELRSNGAAVAFMVELLRCAAMLRERTSVLVPMEGNDRTFSIRPGDNCAYIYRFGVGGKAGRIRMAFSSNKWGALHSR